MIVRPVLCRPFVGRLDELAYLRERRLEAGSSRGGLVLIAGDAGVGKSRLIDEFFKSLAYSRWKIGTGACVEFASRPYGPILEALAAVDTGRFELEAAATKQEQFDAIVERIAAIGAKTAVVIAIEDVHWADAATLDLLVYLAAKLHRMRALVVASLRADELHPEHPATTATAKMTRNARAGRIDLAPLQGIELQTFIDEALDGFSLPDETRRAISIAGDGNPFFTEELLKSAVERSSSHPATPTKRDLPQTVRTTLLDRLRPFDEAERRVVTQAAVIGRTFGLPLLAATLQTDAALLLPTLRRARDFQLVEEVTPAIFRFRHGLTRDAIYGGYLGAELQPRHRLIALALEAAPPAEGSLEALAYHWWAAGDGARATHYNERAGDAAGAVHAHLDAIAFYERAIERDVEPVERGSIIKKMADRRLALGQTKEAQATYAAAADIFRGAAAYEREASCRAIAAITAYGTGLPDPTGPLTAMLSRLSEAEYLARARVHLGLAWLAATFSFPTEAARQLRQVDARAIEQAPDVALRFHNVAAFVAMTIGNIATFRHEHAAWVAAAGAADSLHALAGAHTNGAMGYAFFGLHAEAQEHLDRALRVSRDAHSRHNEESVHAFAALCYLLRGDVQLARAELDLVPTTSENHVNITFATAWGTVIGALLDDQGFIEKWFDGFEATVLAKPEPECGGAFAEILVRRGRERDAADLLHRALPDCELLRGNIGTLLAVGRHGALADRKRAREYLVRAAQAPDETPERWALALFDAIECRRAGREEAGAALAAEAADGFRRLRFPLFEAEALELAGDTEGALRVWRRCGATHEVRRLEGNAGGTDASATATAAQSLSPREREIALLAVAGRSNLEIARALSVTHKTVEKHLASAYRKLGIASRQQLAAHLEQPAR